MQGTADVHHGLTDALLPQADPVFDDTTALHPTVHMLNPQLAVGEGLIGRFLLQGQFLVPWFLGRHQDGHVGKREGQEAQTLQRPTPSKQGDTGWPRQSDSHGRDRHRSHSERGLSGALMRSTFFPV